MAVPVSSSQWVGLDTIPDEVKAILSSSTSPRRPTTDPTLGIPVTVNREGTPTHRLVTLGDSLSHGFQSGAVFNTSLSFPRLIARELGWGSQFRYPLYTSPGDGFPLNLEKLARELGDRYAVEDGINALDFALLMPWLRGYMDKIEDYWERGAGAKFPTTGLINHNLAVYGWDLRNTLSRTADTCLQVIQNDPPKDDFLTQIPNHSNEIAALWVLNTARDPQRNALSPLEAAAYLSLDGTSETGEGDGIETLIILIGANNALGSILTFKVVWSGDDYQDMDKNDQYTVWLPSHFQAELERIVTVVNRIKARHVIWGTVPHVTIVPFAKGINRDNKGNKISAGSRYFPYYTLPWLDDNSFNPRRHPHLTSQQARVIDSVIDQYNEAIEGVVRKGRQQGKDWYLFETVALLDRLAERRYIDDPAARPDWWTPYPLPDPLAALDPKPTSQLFLSGPRGRTQGGLFSLDGIHPTTIGYGIMAQELIQIMQRAGVPFYDQNGKPRSGSVTLDFNRLIQEDTLISDPPAAVSGIMKSLEWFDGMTGIISQLLRSNL